MPVCVDTVTQLLVATEEQTVKCDLEACLMSVCFFNLISIIGLNGP